MSQNRTQSSPAQLANRQISTRVGIQPAAVEWLLICCGNDDQLFKDTRKLIQPENFTVHEIPLRIAYQAMIHDADNYNGFTFQTLSSTAQEILRSDESLLLTAHQHTLLFADGPGGILKQIADPQGVEFSGPNISYARTILVKFAEERLVHQPLLDYLNPNRHGQGHIPDQLEDFLSSVQTVRSNLVTANQVPRVVIAPEFGTPVEASHIYRPTGVEFIDETLGGFCDGDCNGLIGPTGGGKTTLAINLATSAAEQAWTDTEETGEDAGVSIYITAEENASRLLPRIYANFFQIERERVELILREGWHHMSRPGELLDYETKMQHDQEDKLSEFERYESKRDALNRHMELLDLSGSAQYPDAGFGFIGECVSYISRMERPIRSVAIDYAGLLIDNHIEMNNLHDDKYRKLLGRFGQMCRQQIAEQFGCSVLVLHQLKGDASTWNPTKLIAHTDAEGCKSFAVNMASCMCLGTEDPRTKVRRLNISKSRHKTSLQPLTLRIHDQFAYMENVTGDYVINEASRSILTASEAANVRAADVSGGQAGPSGLQQNNTRQSQSGVFSEV